MEYAFAKHGVRTFGQLDNRNSLGNHLDNGKNAKPGWGADVDQVDIAPFQGRSVDEPLLESINTHGICMYADIGDLEDLAYVKSSLAH